MKKYHKNKQQYLIVVFQGKPWPDAQNLQLIREDFLVHFELKCNLSKWPSRKRNTITQSECAIFGNTKFQL